MRGAAASQSTLRDQRERTGGRAARCRPAAPRRTCELRKWDATIPTTASAMGPRAQSETSDPRMLPTDVSATPAGGEPAARGNHAQARPAMQNSCASSTSRHRVVGFWSGIASRAGTFRLYWTWIGGMRLPASQRLSRVVSRRSTGPGPGGSHVDGPGVGIGAASRLRALGRQRTTAACN
jgi:hypothetical protein